MYSKAFRALMVQKMTDPAGSNPEVLADEIGVSRASLYRWLKDAAIIEQRTIDPVELPTTISRPLKMKRPQDWSAKEKLAAVLEAASLSDEDLGAFLRSKGLHNTQLQQWQEQMLAGLEPVGVR